MNLFWGRVRQQVLGISRQEVTFARRGFYASNWRSKQRLEQIGEIFLFGYHVALGNDRPDVIAHQLGSIEAEFRGFAFEGAAMGLALLDVLAPWQNNRLQQFLQGPGSDHQYMVYVGVGWVLARLRRPIARSLQPLNPLLGWLAVDGYGFHEGYFHWQRTVLQQRMPRQLSGYAQRVFDQGLGRSLWFVNGADVPRIILTIAAFPQARQADLWSGVGLACAYAGGADRAAVEILMQSAGVYQSHLAQGVAFAAKARQCAVTPSDNTEMACNIICDCSGDEAADICDRTLENLPEQEAIPAYENWRQQIQAKLTLKQIIV